MFRTFVVIAALAAALPALGATWHVARDGTGEFSVIQAAVDAAASGDTIMIGPGRYNEGAIVVTPGWTEFVRVLIRQPELTLIGAGPTQTIIGPTTPWDLSQGWNIGIEMGSYWGHRRGWISGIGFENMAFGVTGAEAPESATIRDCRFTMDVGAVSFAYGGALTVSDCEFNLAARNDREIFVSGLQSVQIENCRFNLAPENRWYQKAVQLQSVANAVVTTCSFTGGDAGLGLHGVGAARVSHCAFSDQTSSDGQFAVGIYVAGGAVTVTECVFDTQTNAIFAESSAELEVMHTQVLDASKASLNFVSLNALTVHDCVLARGPRYTVWQEFPCDTKASAGGLPHLDMTGNDWGTSNADSIASWIRTCEYVVDFVPYVGQPVAVERKTFGEVKALFR